MKYTLAYPIGNAGADTAFAEPAVVASVALAAEKAGFDALAMTDHPAPSRKWLDNGGHPGFDPFAALSFCAGVTNRIRLMTYLLVVPYRNPLLAARSVATLDRLSGGRLDLVVGTGYLRSEFAALGVDYERRAELLDEGIDVLRNAFGVDSFRFDGIGFVAPGNAITPGPIQMPHPPIWIGGNGARARARAARVGDGWSPIQADEQVIRTTGGAPLDSLPRLRAAIADLHERLADTRREREAVTVQLQSKSIGVLGERSPDEVREAVGELGEIGVNQLVVRAPCERAEETINAIELFGADIITSASASINDGRR
ncbi:MAG: LLM class F420-dependent oxidoreductase [Gordonia sp.]|nr:LLM class F420-dependent oxidoreductase [Gordonia sp. (in: high G+C Gram-positive bacteria)]